MPRVCFWNMRRLGEGSDQDRKEAIASVFSGLQADYTLFCELTTRSVYPQAQNVTYRGIGPAQLCYGCLDSGGNNVALTRYTPTITADYAAAAFKGGTDFTNLANRAVGSVGRATGVAIYVIHAPAGSSSARKVMAYLACHFNQIYLAAPWLLIGAFNVEPADLRQAPVANITWNNLIREPGEPTYLGQDRDKVYDYVLSNVDVQVRRVRSSPRSHNSDHYPIIAEW